MTDIQDIENIFDSIYAYVPDVVDSIRQISDENGLKSMGSCGASSYYCTNYMSPQHSDRDKGWSLCSQLFKNVKEAGGNPATDFNFAFTKWGLYIVTEPRCVWYVHRHLL